MDRLVTLYRQLADSIFTVRTSTNGRSTIVVVLSEVAPAVVVPAVGSAYPERRMMFTVNMQVQYLDAVRGEDAIAEAWVEKRGRSLVFTRVEVRTASDVLAATGALVYKVASLRPA